MYPTLPFLIAASVVALASPGAAQPAPGAGRALYDIEGDSQAESGQAP